MELTDTHSHIYLPDFKDDIESVIKSCKQAGIQRIFLPNIDLESVEPVLELSKNFPGTCFPMMGLHPCSVFADFEEVLGKLKPLFDQHKFYAVGEIGIDLYWDKTFIDQQKLAFAQQIEWAKEMNLPIVLHVRESFNEVFEIVDKLNDDRLTGIFHCFTGDVKQAQHIINYGGFKIGIGGVVTYKTSTLPEVLKLVPLEHIVLETDSPYLPPVPFRGKRNESAYVMYVAKKLAEVYGIPMAKIAEITTKNANEVFKTSSEI
jgi:TatD DNase family protein